MFLCTNHVLTGYDSSAFLGHATQMGKFTDTSDAMFEGKLIRISMNRPSVNLKF